MYIQQNSPNWPQKAEILRSLCKKGTSLEKHHHWLWQLWQISDMCTSTHRGKARLLKDVVIISYSRWLFQIHSQWIASVVQDNIPDSGLKCEHGRFVIDEDHHLLHLLFAFEKHHICCNILLDQLGPAQWWWCACLVTGRKLTSFANEEKITNWTTLCRQEQWGCGYF